MNNIPRSPVKSKKARASPHQRAPTVNDISMTQNDPTDNNNYKAMTTKNKSRANNASINQQMGDPSNIKDMASELIEKYSNHSKMQNSFMNQSQDNEQKPNLNSFELSSRQKRAERLKELSQPLGSFRKKATDRGGADKVPGHNPVVKDTPKRTAKAGRGSPLGKQRERGSMSGMGQFINSSAKKKSSSQAYIHPDDRNKRVSSKKKRTNEEGPGKGTIHVEVDLEDIQHDDVHNKKVNAINTGRARESSDQMTFEFQNDPTESQSIQTPVINMKRDEVQTPQQIISQRSINESDLHGRNSFLMASQKNRLKEREAAQSAAAIEEAQQNINPLNHAMTLNSQHSQSLASQISQVEGLIQGANKIIDSLPSNTNSQTQLHQNPRANKAEQWKKRDQKAQNIQTSDNAIFKNPYLNLGRTDQSAKKEPKKEATKQKELDLPVMIVQRSNQRSQQVKEDEINKNDTATISVGMIHTPRKSTKHEYPANSTAQEQTPYMASPSPQNHQQPQGNGGMLESAKMHANFLQNQFARESSSEDISRSPSLTKTLHHQDQDYQMRQHSLIREQLERKNRETMSKIDDYQEEVGISRVLPGAADQSYGTNSTFKRESHVMPVGIHERAGSNIIDATMVGTGQPIRELNEPKEEFRMGQRPPSNYGRLQSQKSNARQNESDSQPWEDVRDQSPVLSNGQMVNRSSVGVNDEYVEWLEANNMKKDHSQEIARSSQEILRKSQQFKQSPSPNNNSSKNMMNQHETSNVTDNNYGITIVENIGIGKNTQYRANQNFDQSGKRKSPTPGSKHVTPDRNSNHKQSRSRIEQDYSEQSEYCQNLRDLNAEYMKVIQQQKEQLQEAQVSQEEMFRQLEQVQKEKEEMEAKLQQQEDKIRELKFDHEDLQRKQDTTIKEVEEQHDKKMQGIINDYEKILATMQQQQDDSSQHRKDVEAKLMETENKHQQQETLLKEKDDKIISLEQKALYYDDKIREIEKELEFERKMSQLAQQNLKKAEKEKEEVLEEQKKELQKAQEASILVTENLEASMAQLKVKEEEIRTQQQKEEKDIVNEKIIHQLKNNNEVLQQQNILMDGQLRKLQQDFQCQMLIEQEIRTKNEQVLNTVRQLEYVNRQKDEELQAQRKNVEIAQRDLKNLAWSEQQLKLEITQLNQKRIEAEETIQQFKQQICAQWIFQKQKEMEVESLVRENRSLQANYQLIQQTVLDNSSEINRHKEHSSYFEREKFNLKNQLDQYQREISRLNEENLRVNTQLQRERSDRAEEFTRLNGQMSNQRDQLTTQLEQIESQQNQITNLQKQQIMQQEQNLHNENNLKQQLQTAREEMMRKRPMSVVNNRVSEPMDRDDREDQEEDQDETEPMTIRERYLKMQKQAENNQGKKTQGIRWASNETDDDQIVGGQGSIGTPNNGGQSTIQWASRAKSLDKTQSRGKIAFPSQQQQNQERNDFNIKNQNDSQLYDILGWQSNRHSGGQNHTERASSENRFKGRGSTAHDDVKNKKSTAHHNMFDSSQAPWGMQGGTERQGQGGGNQTFNRRYTQQDQGSWTHKRSQNELQYENDVNNYHNNSEFMGGGGFNAGDPSQLEKQLSMKMIEKDQLEQEFWRIGTKSKTKQDIMKKRELETALERSKQSIQQIKNRLKDLK